MTRTVSLTFTGSATSYITITTVIPKTNTVVIQETQTALVATTTTISQNQAVPKRQATAVPSVIPSYASACSGMVRYSSACSCLGVRPTTITVATPVTTTTITVSVTPTTSTLLTTVQTVSTTSTETTLTTSTTTTTTSSVATVTACNPYATIVKNPSFEQGYDGWTFMYGSQFAENPQPAGTDGLKAAGFNLPANGGADIQQTFNTVTGNTYSGSVDYFFAQYTENCYLNGFLNGAWFWSFSPRYSAIPGSWATVPISWTGQSYSDKLDIQFVCTAGESNILRLDNIRILTTWPVTCPAPTES